MGQDIRVGVTQKSEIKWYFNPANNQGTASDKSMGVISKAYSEQD
jgi:hypothetical protein